MVLDQFSDGFWIKLGPVFCSLPQMMRELQLQMFVTGSYGACYISQVARIGFLVAFLIVVAEPGQTMTSKFPQVVRLSSLSGQKKNHC